MIVFIPAIINEAGEKENHGKTIESNPLIFIYIPEGSKNLKTKVMRPNGDLLEERKISVSKQVGILQTNLLAYGALEADETYKIVLDLTCESGDSLEFSGFITRQNLSKEMQQLLDKEFNSLAKAQIYADNEIWFEALALIASARQRYPEAWEEFLNSVGLEAYKNEDLIIFK